MTRISVLLPLYNGERYIREAVESVLAQSHREFELLVLDDGSTDRSLQIVNALAAGDARVRVISRENRGLVATLNELLAQARSDVIARMDADDVCLPNRFERQLAFLEANPQIVCVGGDVEMIDECGRFLTTLNLPQHDADIQREALKGHAPLFHPAAMIRTAALRAIEGYRADYWPAEDLDLWLRLGEVGQLANLPKPVLRYRLHGGSISGNNVSRQRDAARRCCESAWQRRGVTDARFEAGDPWRPAADAPSQHRFMLRFGWWAFQSGQRSTTLIYGLKAIRHQPLASSGWRLLACGLCKPMKPVPRN